MSGIRQGGHALHSFYTLHASKRRVRFFWYRCAALLSCLGLLAGCSINADPRTVITVWSWEPNMVKLARQFEQENPDIHVQIRNTSGYENLNRALQDGYGIPDVAQIEYFAIPQYAASGQLLDLTNRAASYSNFYTSSAWSAVHFADALYGLPMDTGPLAMFYNKEAFDQAHIDPNQIRTWQDYYEAAKKLKLLGYTMLANSGQASLYNSFVWLAQGKPFSTSHDGMDVKLSLNSDKGTQEFISYWQRFIDEELIDTSYDMWSDGWKRQIAQGNIATIIAGAWFSSLFLQDIPSASGLWRVSRVPTLDGTPAGAQDGGSALTVLELTRKPKAAYRFVEYVCHNQEGIQTRVDGGAFPADNATLSSQDFISRTTVQDRRGVSVNFFGGQEYNEVLAQAAQEYTPYQYLPYEVYAREDFERTVGRAFHYSALPAGTPTVQRTSDGKLVPVRAGLPELLVWQGIEQWQEDLLEYGNNQGFHVTVSGQ